ncbi:MAG: translation elongation factor EF-1 subunit alpha [Nitrososphaerota archaeon]|nr:translation elongation factor EF-1 subunit alpha [Nitrososphaerota archaeon]MDG6967178.1 translation elongation factor EF-1 subunit alpha [Nitrososphaerota archaeon]MDG6978813.1 translation elongation factor EF-1 subunit alpha [Nitrososphaerota archaeon]MDG7020706.1 translation elongation factor EF-1 subunit alpha [Nitrososphaerota archaeon]
MADKPHLNLIVTGHVDHGKSTSMGHFLFDLGAVDDRTIAEYAKESEKTGAGDSFKYAWVLDQLKDERERGVTIDLAFQKFETPKFFYTLIDAPGHRDFIKNMITGASEADAAVLVVSAKTGERETALGPGGQAREHAFLLKTLGVNQLVVCINKMDDQTVKYAEKAYNDAKQDVENLLKASGYNVTKIRFIPTSGWTGENLVKASTNMPWYKGPTLLQALDEFSEPPKPIEKPLRVPIQDVYTITGVGTVPVGRVETGHMKVGDPVVIMPEGLPAEIKSIETHHTAMQEAFAGDNIGFNLRGVAKTDFHRGSVLGPPSSPPTIAKEFLAQIVVVFHPTAIAAGYTPVLHAHTAQVAATITEIVAKLDPRTGQPMEEKPKTIKTGDSAIVKITPLRPLVLETFKEFPELGRFALRDMGSTVAAGIVREVTVKGTVEKAVAKA